MSDNQLVNKITKAAIEIGGSLKADKRNNEQGYDYLSADKILSICGQALFTQGVAILPEVSTQTVNMFEYTDQYGKVKRRYDATVGMNFYLSDGEEYKIMSWYGVGSDYSVPDKAMYKAVTSGHKYFLMKLFCIGEGNEDGEHEEEPKEQKQTKQEQRKPAPAQAPARAAEIVTELGFTPPAASQTAELTKISPSKPGAMTIGEAMNETAEDGTTYGNMETPALANRMNSMMKVKGTESAKPEHARKMAAIQMILNARKNK